MNIVKVSSKGQIAIPKEARKALHIQEGDQLAFEIREGKLILEPVVNIPRSQAWFWTQEVQDKIKKAEENYQEGNYTRHEVDDLVKDLNE